MREGRLKGRLTTRDMLSCNMILHGLGRLICLLARIVPVALEAAILGVDVVYVVPEAVRSKEGLVAGGTLVDCRVRA